MPDYRTIEKYEEREKEVPIHRNYRLKRYEKVVPYQSEIPYSRQTKQKLVHRMVDKKTEPSQRKLIRNELNKRLDRGEV